MENKLIEQKELIESLQNIKTTYGRDSEDRKTYEYLEKRITTANNYWQTFSKNDEDLQAYKATATEQPYFKNDTFNTTKALYTDIILMLQLKLHEVKGDSDDDDRHIQRTWQLARVEMIDLLILMSAVGEADTRGALEIQIESAKGIWKEVRKKYLDAQDIADEDNADANKKNYEALFQRYITVIGKVQDAITDLNTMDREKKKYVELPKLKLPDFDGKMAHWSNFIELFNQIVHNNKAIGDDARMQYLKTSVKGEAARLIGHLQTTARNYETAYNILTKRYANTRVQLGKLLDLILDSPPLAGETCNGLKNLHDTVYECLLGVKNLKINIENWDSLLTHLLIKKLDKETRKHYECQLDDPREPQRVDDFLKYIESRFMALEAYEPKGNEPRPNDNMPRNGNNNNAQNKHNNRSRMEKHCIVCDKSHAIYECEKFNQLSDKERVETAKQKKLCMRCLRNNHQTSACKSTNKCKTCDKLHHTLLHIKDYVPQKKHEPTKKPAENSSSTPATTTKTCAAASTNNVNTILATALVKIKNQNGEHMIFKALIDQGSQSTFISEHAAQTLAIPRQKISATITGIGSQEKRAKSIIAIQVRPRIPSDFELHTNAVVLDKLTRSPELDDIDESKWYHLQNLTLANPQFKNDDKIDILFGAGDYGKIIRSGLLKGDENAPIAQNTEFGWIISGEFKCTTDQNEIKIMSMVSTAEIDARLKTFWEINEITDDKTITEEEEMCENHFEKTHKRLASGRYVVKLPFKNAEMADIGESRNMAIATFLQLEKKFMKQPEFFIEYKKFIDEYIALGHMVLADINSTNQINYLPHHAVMKDSTTTKLRAVFDASRKTSNHKSLNDNLAVGPLLQRDMVSLIIGWRKYAIGITADIEKMYRQIYIDESQTDLQRIIWRNSPRQKLQEYKLLTISYGTANAPYLAIRTLQQLAKDEEERYPIAAEIIRKEFYVDDLLSGADDVDAATKSYYEISSALNAGGFHLRKWKSNSEDFMKIIPEADRELNIEQEIKIDVSSKTLGIHWLPGEDSFTFKINLSEDEATTKRILLSEIASLYDPLGWISPVIIKAKILIQDLWVLGVAWDDELPNDVKMQWTKIKSELHNMLSEIRVSRWLNTYSYSAVELHGFCDASEKAYAAVIYMKTTEDDNVKIAIVAAKTKVAPIKKSQVTIPRLELCGAWLLAKLSKQVIEALQINNINIFMWSDSKVALAWIKGNPKRWKKFVANKVIAINALTKKNSWNYVSSPNNPADVASRGIYPRDIKNHTLWWNGPSWLQLHSAQYPNDNIYETNEEQKEKIVALNVTIKCDILPDVSSFFKLQKIIAVCLRFANNCNKKKSKQSGPHTINELRAAASKIIQMVQHDVYENEINVLSNENKQLEKSSALIKLNPYVDHNGILRVGGRIENADIKYEAKHQIILPRSHNVTKLIIRMTHQHSIHGGAKLTEALLRQRYWIPRGLSVIKAVIHECTTCRRYNKRTLKQQMGALPASRVNGTRAFKECGIDYAGPIQVRTWKGRGHKSHKAYIAVFICMATKAIHLECVSDMTSISFIAALHRFISRRGVPSDIYSDNGTNFVGANKMLELKSKQEEAEYNEAIYKEFQKQQIEWHFIPPLSPHFGGLWEAAVKSMKTHLKKAIGDSTLTFEELTTLLNQIEASLNSRPLCALSNDPDDISSLTPGHFLIGEPLLTMPEENVLDTNTNRLSRWQTVQKMHQNFWKRWQTEYLTRLQERPKWLQKEEEPKVGDLVLLKDENLPPSKWAMGRILQTHPGSDNLTRVVTLKTQNNVLQRPITKICPLISDEQPEDEDANNEVSTQNGSSSSTKISLSTIIIMLAMLFASINATPTEKITLRPFANTPGIYFENYGQAQLTDMDWTIITYYDLKVYLDEIGSIRKSVNTIKEICETTNVRKIQCRETAGNLQQHLNELEDYNEVIWPTNKRRRKRATLDIVGNILNDVFGVLDSKFRDQYLADISKISTNEQHVLQLLKNHTSIEETTINILRKDEEMIKSNYETIHNLATGIHMLENNDEANTQLMLSAIQIVHAMVKYEATQKAIMNALVSAHGNKLSPTIITPQQLKKQLQTIRQHIDGSLGVPEDYTHNSMKTLYQIMNVKAMVTGDKIIFKSTLPLLHNEKFQIFKLIPVPTKEGSNLLWIESTVEFLLATINRGYFYPITEQEYEKCIEYGDNQFICERNKPLFTATTDKNKCEINLLEHKKQVTGDCQIRKTDLTNVWIPLQQTKQWIYVLPSEYAVDIICDNDIEHQNIEGEGILSIQQKCILKHDTMELSGMGSYEHEIKGSILPQLNLSSEMTKKQHRQENTQPKYIKPEWNTTEEKLRNDRENEQELPENLDIHDIHHYSLGYTTIIIVVIFFAYFYFMQIKPMRAIRRQIPMLQQGQPQRRTISMPNIARENV